MRCRYRRRDREKCRPSVAKSSSKKKHLENRGVVTTLGDISVICRLSRFGDDIRGANRQGPNASSG